MSCIMCTRIRHEMFVQSEVSLGLVYKHKINKYRRMALVKLEFTYLRLTLKLGLASSISMKLSI